MEELKKCDLCGSNNIVELYNGKDEYFSKKEVVFSVCKNCSLVFLNPRLKKEEYAEMYAKIFQDKRRNLKTVAEAVKRLKKKGSYDNKRKFLKYFQPIIDKDSKCLEIGAGWGTLSKVVVDDIGCSIDVVELSELASKTAKEHYGLNVYNCDFEEFYKKLNGDSKYDLIFSFHVFEHILEPNDFLDKAKSLLNKKGKLLLAVPDIANPDQPYEKFFHIEHCYYYSPNTLKLMLEKHGFRVDGMYKDRLDFKVVCSLDNLSKNIIDFKNNEISKIKRILFLYNLKFKVLRFLKRIVFVFVGEKNRKKVSAFVAKFLRKFKFIKV